MLSGTLRAQWYAVHQEGVPEGHVRLLPGLERNILNASRTYEEDVSVYDAIVKVIIESLSGRNKNFLHEM